ncbi:M14 family zinc carboxypeptidase [Phytoactinopolyspora limicola]|uniref:M14 family zinc carboxypeptidase n=1 Tax=Phytoactinopolyspora limicola TaxID=2715536 RepID=UPI00140B1869|nr:M14 family zinc carboxypeptidase [Phytoactinopolyspora limicola]
MARARFRPLTLGSAVAALAVASTAFVGVPAVAEPTNAHCGTETGGTGTSAWIDHEELRRELTGLEQRSHGRLSVDVVGESNRGREIWAARVGEGDRVVLVQSEIHGNEKTGTDALVSLLRKMSAPTPQAQRLRENVTLVAIPKMNPDAAELDRRGNDRSWADVVADFPQLDGAQPAWNYYTGVLQGDDYRDRPGFDVNRDFHPLLDYIPQPADFPGASATPGWYIHPESQAVRDVYRDLQVEFGNVDVFIDLHHQAPCYVVDGTNNWVTLSLSGKFIDIENHEHFDQGYDLDAAKRATLAAYDALQQARSPFSNISLYPQNIDLPGTALGSLALNGSASVLFEVRGQTHSWGAKKRGQLITAVERGVMGIVEAVADGTIDELDADRYDDIPDRG